MTITIARRYRFRATHHLPTVGQPWNKPHHHDYTVEITATGTPGADGLIIDTDRIDDAWNDVAPKDGTNLNRLYTDTSVESLSAHYLQQIHKTIAEVDSVTVWEDDERWGRATR